MEFLCTPFAPWAIEALLPFVDAWKIGSFEADHRPLLGRLAAEDPDRVKIVSTGVTPDATLAIVRNNFPSAIMMHCTSIYPTDLKDSALNRIESDRIIYDGFSDHTHRSTAPAAAIAAYAMGCRCFERHVQLHSQPKSPDAGEWASKPAALGRYISTLRDVARSIKEEPWKDPKALHSMRLVNGK